MTTSDNNNNNHNENSHLLSKHDDHHDHGGHSVRQLHEKVPLYSRPKQRQRWDETQILPHVNWGDLFFDLYYVAAAFQLSHAFQHEPTSLGLLYFIACFCPVVTIWYEKLQFDAKFAPDDNLFHRSMEIVHLCLLGTIVQHIQPVTIMANTKDNPTMLVFSTSLLFDGLWQLYLYTDLVYNVEGGPEARHDSRMQLQRKSISTTFFILASTVCAHDYFFLSKQQEGEEVHANFWPAYLLILSFLFESVLWTFLQVYILTPRLVHTSHKEITVPLNLEFVIHRMGEWIMLMLGESVLSILTMAAPSEGGRNQSVSFTICTYVGLLTVTLFQYLYFRTQPTEAKDHAARRSRTGGMINFYAGIAYSASLIMVGCSFKMILSSFGEHEEEEEGFEGTTTTYYYYEEKEDFENNQNQLIAKVYCRSLTMSFLMLDFQLISHRGWSANLGRMCPQNQNENQQNQRKISWKPLFLTILLFIITAMALNLSQWMKNDENDDDDLVMLSIWGLILVIGQVLVRTIGLRYFPISKEAMDRALKLGEDYNKEQQICSSAARWPNMTEPQSIPNK